MPAQVRHDPLAVEFVFGDASRYTARLDHLPCPVLVADLALGLAGLAHPHGGINARSTVEAHRTAIGLLARFADGRGVRGGAGALTRMMLVEFWLGGRAVWESLTRAVLRSTDAACGVLHPQVRDFLAGNALQQYRWRGHQPYRPYSDTEWDRLRTCCQQVTQTAFAGHTTMVEAGQDGADPTTGGWSIANRAWLLLRYGPLSQIAIASHTGRSTWEVGRSGVGATARALFPRIDVALAYRLLLGMTTGIVPDGLDDLELGDIDWAGDTSVLLDYVKGRAGPQSLVLPTAAVGVLRDWLEHSAPLRRFAPEPLRANLWLVYDRSGPRGSTVMAPAFSGPTVHSWVRRHDLRGDDDEPLRLHKHRIRTTFTHRRDTSAWTGRTTIDPNRSAQVEGDHYLCALTPAQTDALQTVIEDAQRDLLRKASAPVVIGGDTLDTAGILPPGRLAGLTITDTVMAQLVGGRRDVFSAGCVDQLAGLHGQPGTPCPARPWVCLLCPLAVFAPRHAPNLLRLRAFFTRQFQQMPTRQFMAVFGPYQHRLDHDILPRFAPAVLAAAKAGVRDDDDELPLRPEERTT